MEQTFGHRLALTTPESQSGYAAPLHALMAYGIVAAFLAADRQAESRALMEPLLLARFEEPECATYDALRQRFETMRAFWRSHPLAETTHPTFAL